jgi:urease accessory protein
MLIASKRIPGGAGLAPVLVRRAATLELDWDTRQKSRFDAVDSQGRRIGVFLPRGGAVRGGDVLVAEDGSLIAIQAKAEPLLAVTAGPHGAPLDLLRAAYHLGNRHVPLEVTPTRLQLAPDHVLAEMLRRMGLVVETVEAAFEPEGGAYDAASAGAHRPDPGHDPGHGHDHDHEHGHGHEHGHEHGHGHGHAHAHGHGHEHGQAQGDANAHGQDHGYHDHEHREPGRDHDHGHDHGHDDEPGHVHGPGCGHDHP